MADRYARGADGEEATARALSALTAQGWVVLHDVAWPGRRLANIDHVAIGPPGVFVVDSKNWSGRLTVERGVLRQNGRARTASVTGAKGAASDVADLLSDVPRRAVRAVLAFTTALPTQRVGGVLVCSTETITTTLASQPALWSPEQVQVVAGHLWRTLVPATSSRSVGGPAARPVGGSRHSERRPRATRSSCRPRDSRHRWTAFVRPLVGLALVGTVLLNPGIVASGTERLSQLLSDRLTPSLERLGQPVEQSRERRPAREQQPVRERDRGEGPVPRPTGP